MRRTRRRLNPAADWKRNNVQASTVPETAFIIKEAGFIHFYLHKSTSSSAFGRAENYYSYRTDALVVIALKNDTHCRLRERKKSLRLVLLADRSECRLVL